MVIPPKAALRVKESILSSVEEIGGASFQEPRTSKRGSSSIEIQEDGDVQRSWARGNILFHQNEQSPISPVSHFKQPKISVFSNDGIGDWKAEADSFVEDDHRAREKRAKLQDDKENVDTTVKIETIFKVEPRVPDKTKQREGAGNQTMEDLAKGHDGTPEILRSQSHKMFRYCDSSRTFLSLQTVNLFDLVFSGPYYMSMFMYYVIFQEYNSDSI